MTALILPLLPPVIILAAVMLYARIKAFDTATVLLLLVAIATYYFHFYNTTWKDFTIDAEPHMAYIDFIRDHHRLPVPADAMGAATRHPPAFYVASAGMLNVAEVFGLKDTSQFVRHVAMACYMVFIVMSIGILRLLLAQSRGAYLCALLILLFWPIGVTMGGRISCDIWLFAAQAGALFALMRWQKDKTPERLCAPFLWAGVAVMGKNSGIFMLLFAAIALGETAFYYRRNLRALLRADVILSILFAVACNSANSRHSWIMQHVDDTFGTLYFWDYLWSMMGTFNAFLFMYDTNLGLSQDSFWNMWLHTLLLGGGTMRWNYPSLVLACKVVWIALLFYSAEGLIKARKQLLPTEKNALGLLMVFIALMMAAAMYLLMRTANPNYADARYAYPAVIAFALMHGLAMKHHLSAGRFSFYRIGILLSLAFAGLTLALFAAQFLG